MEVGKCYVAYYGDSYYFIKYKEHNSMFIIGETYIVNSFGFEKSYSIMGDIIDFTPVDEDTFLRIKTIFETNMPILDKLCKTIKLNL